MARDRFTGRDLISILSWLAVIAGVLVVLVLPADLAIKIGGGAAVIGAFWAGRSMNWDR